MSFFYFLIPVSVIGCCMLYERHRIHTKYSQEFMQDCERVLGKEDTIKCAERWLKEHD